jgi:hypothetical protein
MITHPYRTIQVNFSIEALQKLKNAAKLLQLTRSDVIRKCVDRDLDCLLSEQFRSTVKRKQGRRKGTGQIART